MFMLMTGAMVFHFLVILVFLGGCVAQMLVQKRQEGASVESLSKFVEELLGVQVERHGRRQGQFINFVKNTSFFPLSVCLPLMSRVCAFVSLSLFSANALFFIWCVHEDPYSFGNLLN
jgi:Na+-transporting methylmalonyl-CoA/oxaloacetate decarboxylase gamma subunit